MRLVLIPSFTLLIESKVDVLLKENPCWENLRTNAPTMIPEVMIDAVVISFFMIMYFKKLLSSYT